MKSPRRNGLKCSPAAVLTAATVLLAGGGGAQAHTPSLPAPQGKLAIELPRKRGYLLTDFQGRVQRTVSVPRGRAVIGAPQFNPTGSRLWFLAGSGPRYGRKRLWLHVAPSTGSSLGRSYSLRVIGSANSYLRVSSDERRIAVGTWPKNARACGSFAIVTGSGRAVRRFEGGAGIQLTAEAWSPDATRLLYIRHDWSSECGKFSSSGSLLVAGRRGGGPARRLSRQRFGLLGPAAWSPDSRRVALFQSNQRGDLGRSPLHVVDAGRARGRVLVPDSYPSGIAWYRRTGEVIALRVAPNDGIWAFDPNSPGRRRLLEGEADIEAASANGARLVVHRSVSPRGERGILDVATGTYRPFPSVLKRRLNRNREVGAAAYFLR